MQELYWQQAKVLLERQQEHNRAMKDIYNYREAIANNLPENEVMRLRAPIEKRVYARMRGLPIRSKVNENNLEPQCSRGEKRKASELTEERSYAT